ncbi:MAG: dioxygenase [Gammaproteobacteria bacterium]|nr:dioxygenase [Gammaproteobacteria bacterium]
MRRQPVVFVSHGAPSLVLESEAVAHRFFVRLGQTLPRPTAILCISAHWQDPQLALTGAAHPVTIHDFYGFPEALYQLHYLAPGDPELASEICHVLNKQGTACTVDAVRGLDHGAWSPLRMMYPQADIPVLQLSLMQQGSTREHYRLGTMLTALRDQGVLILASGGITHNLRELDRRADAPSAAFAVAFADWVHEQITRHDINSLLDYRRAAPQAQRNHPTEEHLLPLFVALGAAGDNNSGLRILHELCYGALSLDCYLWSEQPVTGWP